MAYQQLPHKRRSWIGPDSVGVFCGGQERHIELGEIISEMGTELLDQRRGILC